MRVEANQTPLLAVRDPEVEDLGDGVFRVTAVVENQGFQPTELAIRVRQNRAVPVRATIDGVEVLSEDATLELGVVAGYDAAEASWIVRAPRDAAFTIRAWHPKAGRAEVESRLIG